MRNLPGEEGPPCLVAVVVHEEVPRLRVAMDHASGLRVLESTMDLEEDLAPQNRGGLDEPLALLVG